MQPFSPSSNLPRQQCFCRIVAPIAFRFCLVGMVPVWVKDAQCYEAAGLAQEIARPLLYSILCIETIVTC